MKHKHKYTVLVSETSNGMLMGMVLEVEGAASFARTEDELMHNLIDAIDLIQEYRRKDSIEFVTHLMTGVNKPVQKEMLCG